MKGICTNWDCPKFDENGKKVQDIPDDEDFICQNPECGKKLQEVSNEGRGFGLWIKEHKLPVIIAAAILVVTAAMLFFLPGNGKGEDETTIPPPDNSTEVVADTIKQEEQPAVIPQDKDTVYIRKDTVIYRTDTVVREKETVRETETTVTMSNEKQILDLGYATWTGKVKNGKPHDVQGTLRFKSQHLIDARDPNKRIANAGDKVIGEFSNGRLVQGFWHKSNGNVESIIIGD